MSSKAHERALETVDAMIERDREERRQSLARILERGGMPTEDDYRAVEAKLNDAFNALEELGIRVRAIAGFSDEPEVSLPFAVTFENIGHVAAFADTFGLDVNEMRGSVKVLSDAVGDLESVRRGQEWASSRARVDPQAAE